MLGAHLLLVHGCVSARAVTLEREQLASKPEMKVTRVILETGYVIRFDEKGGRYVKPDEGDEESWVIAGTTIEGKPVRFEIDSAAEIEVEETRINVAGTVLVVAAGAALVISLYYVIIWLFYVSISPSKR